MQNKLRKIRHLIGNSIIIGFFIMLDASEPVLRVASMQGTAINEIEKQSTCQLEISIAGDHYGKPVFELPSQAKLIREGISKSYAMTSKGMSQTTTYGYTLLFSTEGNFTLGPATINTDHGEKKTNSITVKVVAEIKKKESDYAGFFVLGTKKLYEGDIVSLKLQSMIDPLNIQRIDVPHISHEHIKQLKQWHLQYRDVRRVNDQQMLCQEWVTEIQCDKTGTYEFPIKSLKALVGSNGFFMSMFASQMSIPLKPLVIECLPLPLYQGRPVSLLGNIRSLETKLSGSTVEIGKALTLDLVINYDTRCIIKEMPVIEMPDGINCYFSQERNEPNKKILSYIIHPIKEGAYSINAQKIPFFNSAKEELGTVSTLPLSFKVKAGVSLAAHNNAPSAKTENNTTRIKPFELSLFGVLFCAFFPLIILALLSLKRYVFSYIYRRYMLHTLLQVLKRNVYQLPNVLYEDIDQLVKKENYESLHDLLVHLHYPEEAINSAHQWWEYLIKLRYAPEKQQNNELTIIIKKWIERYG